MRVKELAEQSGIAPHVIRYYTRRGLLHPSRESGNRYRAYTGNDVHRLQFIRNARWLGFTLKDVEAILGDADRGVSPCPEVRDTIARRARENHERLAVLNGLQRRMADAIALWSDLPDRKPTNEHLCYLIDLVAAVDERLT